MKNIINYNSKSQCHGYQEWYWGEELKLRAYIKMDKVMGYEEFHGVKQTNFYIR